MREGKFKKQTIQLPERIYAQLLKYTDLNRAKYAKDAEEYQILQRLSFCENTWCECCPIGQLNLNNSGHYCYKVMRTIAGPKALNPLDIGTDGLSWDKTENRWARHYIKKLHDWLLTFKQVKT